MNVIDAVIILTLLCGAVLGFKKGLIKSIVSFVGTILVILLSFYLKKPLSIFLYTHLPFFKFPIGAINVLIYEAIAFFLVFSCLLILLRLLIKISGMMEFLLKITIVFAIPSKILGAIFGFLEYYLFIYIVLFLLACGNIKSDIITESKLADKILTKTPIVTNFSNNTYKVIKDFMNIEKKNMTDKQKNEEAINSLLKYNIISDENLKIIKEKIN